MKKILKIVLLLVSILYSLNFIFWDMSMPDIFYWMNRSEFYKLEFMNIFSVWLGYIWINIFGNNVVCFRFLGWLCTTSAMTLPFLLLQTKNSAWKNLSFLSIGFVLMGTGTFRLYNPDSTTVLFLSLVTVSIIRFIKEHQSRWFFILCISTALASCSRFPNILILVLIAVILFIDSCFFVKEKKLKATGVSLFYLLLTFSFYLMLVFILSGESDIWNYAKDAVVNHKVGPSHNLSVLLSRYVRSFVTTCSFYILLVVSSLLLYKISKRINKKYIWLFSGIILFLLMKFSIYPYYYNGPVLAFYFFSLCVMLAFKNPKFSKDRIIFVLPIFIDFIAIAGSDTGVNKLFPYSAAMLPIMLCSFNNRICIGTFVKFVLCVWIVFSIYANMNEVRMNTATINAKCMKGTRISEQFRNKYQSEIKLINEYGHAHKNIYYGLEYAHTLYALSDTSLPYLCSYWMFKDDFSELNSIVAIMKKNKGYVFFDYSKSQVSQLKEKGLQLITTTNNCNIYQIK